MGIQALIRAMSSDEAFFQLSEDEWPLNKVLKYESIKEVNLKRMVHNFDAGPSDLLPGYYEGGMKTWECSLDLVAYLRDCFEFKDGMDVFEIGCGSALPSVYLASQDYPSSSFSLQDFNESVLRAVSIPNLVLNSSKLACKKFFFYYGHWRDIKLKTSFDLILTSETIYNPEKYENLLNLMKQGLRRGGIVLVAAKNYYFGEGLGGGMEDFGECARIAGFKTEVVWKSERGIKRSIMRLTL